VNPREVAVLNPGEDEILTLVTCYPFYFIGNAPTGLSFGPKGHLKETWKFADSPSSLNHLPRKVRQRHIHVGTCMGQ
jgi:hypothetical protein